jgi:D-tyrosyl-tRNA(Tyr) deacylase
MIALLQRVLSASVSVGGERVATIGPGLLVFIGIERDDEQAQAERLIQRLLNYRVFGDAEGKMNLSVKDIGGGVLLVPQFTLAADTRAGLRPGFGSAKPPALAKPLFHRVLEMAQAAHRPVAAGIFGADMQVTLINDGPVTFLLNVTATQS